MRRADGGILSGAHLVGGGDHEAQIEGEVEEAHVPRLEPPRVQAHLTYVIELGLGLGIGLEPPRVQAHLKYVIELIELGLGLGIGLEPPRVRAHRVRAHLDEECEVALDDVRVRVRGTVGVGLRLRLRLGLGFGLGLALALASPSPNPTPNPHLDDVMELVGKVVAEGLVVRGVMPPRHGRVGDAAHHEGLAVEHDQPRARHALHPVPTVRVSGRVKG